MTAVCCRCSQPLSEAYDLKDYAVDEREVKEYPQARLKVGELVCEVCMHTIMFPHLQQNRDPEDMERLTDFYLED
jgi:hypothetical protein